MSLRHDPPRIRRVAMEPSAHLVVDAAAGHGGQRSRDDCPQAFLPRSAVPGHDPFHRPRMGEFLLARDAPVHGIELPAEGVGALLQQGLVHDAVLDQGLPPFREGAMEGLGLPQGVRAIRPIILGHGEQDAAETGPTVRVFRREVGASVVGLPVRREEPGQGPASLAGDRADRLLIPRVDVRALVPIHFDRDEMVVDDLGELGVLVRLAVDDVAPMAPRRPDVKEDRPVEFFRPTERILAPWIPGDGLVGRALQIGRGLRREPIRRLLRHAIDQQPRGLWPFGARRMSTSDRIRCSRRCRRRRHRTARTS